MRRIILITGGFVLAAALLGAGLPGLRAKPESHSDPHWAEQHGLAARPDMVSCGGCHLREYCTNCHGEDLAGLDRLPATAEAQQEAWPVGHGPGFAREHGIAAATGGLNCAACHSQGYCTDCHDGATKPGFHPRNYLTRHAAEAYARDTDCTACHSTEVFCRDCHEGAGLSSSDARTWAYHDAQPLWLIAHGQAGRQDLENCAGCHRQSDCLQCHSARGGWGVSPHGSGFEEDLGEKSQLLCGRCHYAVPRD